MKIAILGESKRFDHITEKFENCGYNVSRYLNSFLLPNKFFEDILILPIPTLNKNGFINLKDGSEISAEELLKRTKSDTLIISCNFESKLRETVDINKREDFAFLNAIPTAEAAISLAINELGSTIYNSKCLITGFGRIGKMLATRLNSLLAEVVVSARSDKDLAFIEALGLKPVKTAEIENHLFEFDVVFQTIPSKVLTREILAKQKYKPLIIELSSGCRGTDMTAAEELGYRTLAAGGLPEKYTPKTAGNILYDTVLKILEEKGRLL